jgi:hypothetical protein
MLVTDIYGLGGGGYGAYGGKGAACAGAGLAGDLASKAQQIRQPTTNAPTQSNQPTYQLRSQPPTKELAHCS